MLSFHFKYWVLLFQRNHRLSIINCRCIFRELGIGNKRIVMVLTKVTQPVIPASAGIHNMLKLLDSRLRGNDENATRLTFYKFVNSG